MTALDLDQLEVVARAAREVIDILGFTSADSEFWHTFDPPAVLALIARVRELEAALDSVVRLSTSEAVARAAGTLLTPEAPNDR